MHIVKLRRKYRLPCPALEWWTLALLLGGACLLLWAMMQLVIGMQPEISVIFGPEPSVNSWMELWSEEGEWLRFTWYLLGVLGLSMVAAGLVLRRRI